MTAGLEALLSEARGGSRRAIGRLLTIAERGGQTGDALTKLAIAKAGHAHIVGVTGPPGAGKSTLVGRLVAELAATKRVAVLAIDPSSPLTGGAILGDRVRMDTVVEGRAFIRSMATRGHAGGLALAVPAALRVLSAAGFDVVIVETVGVGQAEVDIAAAADTTVLVVVPGLGDAIQANKAGLLEVADVFVVNKCDRPGADDVRRDLDLMIDLSPALHSSRPAIVMTNAISGDGIDALGSALSAHLARLHETGELTRRRGARRVAEARSRAIELMSRSVDDRLERDPALREAISSGQLSAADAARHLADQAPPQ